MIDCSIRVVTVLLGYLDLLIATSWGPIFGIWGPSKSWGPRQLPTLPTPKAGPVLQSVGIIMIKSREKGQSFIPVDILVDILILVLQLMD